MDDSSEMETMAQGNTKDEIQEEIKDKPQDEFQDELQDEIKDKPQNEIQGEIQDETVGTQKETNDVLSDISQRSLGIPADNKTSEELEWENNIRQTPEFNELLQANLEAVVIFEIFKLVERGIIELSDIDETVRQAVTRFTKAQGVQFFKVLGSKDLSHIARKAPYICAQTKIFSYYVKNKLTIFNGPDPKKISRLQKQTGYPIKVTEGQRCYGPPPDWEGEAPGHHEISVSKIPTDWYEDRLVPIFSKFGKIYQLRIMMDSITGLTRHFCFVQYCNREDSTRALRKLDEYMLEGGQTLKANFSSGNRTIFVGNIPKTETVESLKAKFGPHVHGLHDIDIFVSKEQEIKGLKNRGFCFIEFHSHSYAAEGKKVIAGLGAKLFEDKVLRVEWAEKQYDMSPAESSKVKSVHVSNISSSVTEEMLRMKFEAYGKLVNVQKVRDYAFIHYEDREDCLDAIHEASGTELGGLNIVCRLSTSGPMLRRIKKKNEKAKLRGEFDYGMGKERQEPPPPKHSHRNYESSRNFQSGNRDGRHGNAGYGGHFGRDRSSSHQGYRGRKDGNQSGNKRRYDGNNDYPGSRKQRRY